MTIVPLVMSVRIGPLLCDRPRTGQDGHREAIGPSDDASALGSGRDRSPAGRCAQEPQRSGAEGDAARPGSTGDGSHIASVKATGARRRGRMPTGALDRDAMVRPARGDSVIPERIAPMSDTSEHRRSSRPRRDRRSTVRRGRRSTVTARIIAAADPVLTTPDLVARTVAATSREGRDDLAGRRPSSWLLLVAVHQVEVELVDAGRCELAELGDVLLDRPEDAEPVGHLVADEGRIRRADLGVVVVVVALAVPDVAGQRWPAAARAGTC